MQGGDRGHPSQGDSLVKTFWGHRGWVTHELKHEGGQSSENMCQRSLR